MEEQSNTVCDGFIWIFLRLTSVETGSQEYPGWSGYVSLLGTTPTRLTAIDYYPVIPYPITDYDTVAETLRGMLTRLEKKLDRTIILRPMT